MATITTCDICGIDKTPNEWISLADLLALQEWEIEIGHCIKYTEKYEHLCDTCVGEIRRKIVTLANHLKAGIEDGTLTTRVGCGWETVKEREEKIKKAEERKKKGK